MTIRHPILLLIGFASLFISVPADCQAVDAQPRFVPVTLCGLAFRDGKANPKYVSLDLEFVNASPHGLVLLDHRCPRRGLEVDFANAGLDPTAAMMKEKFWEMTRATGTFRGTLDRDRRTGRLCLTIQSVLNLQAHYFYPQRDDNPIHLPEPQWPTWPPRP